jgi:hypothetical protein
MYHSTILIFYYLNDIVLAMGSKQNKKEVTLKSIAKVAGLSVAAVSKALHNKPDISTETTSRVCQIVQEMGYQPNIIARSLRTGKTNIIGVIIPDNCNAYNALVLKGVEETLQRLGYTAIMGKAYWVGERAEKFLKELPVGRFAEPEETAAVALFLASDASNMIAGETIVIDGGYTIH